MNINKCATLCYSTWLKGVCLGATCSRADTQVLLKVSLIRNQVGQAGERQARSKTGSKPGPNTGESGVCRGKRQSGRQRVCGDTGEHES